MALVFADRVTDTSTTTGTTDFALSGTAPAGFQAWSVIGNTNTAYYTATDGSGNWETGIGTYSSTGPTLARTTVLASSNAGSKVSFPAGTKTVFNDPAAAWLAAPVVTGLLDISATTAGQIEFPASQNASANANTLDDYEKGTFTPAYSATGSTFSYSARIGTYTKIGDRALYYLEITLNTSGNTLAANALTVTGLPFANNEGNNTATLASFGSTATSMINISASLPNAGTSFTMFKIIAAVTSAATMLANDLSATAGTLLRLTSQYRA